MATFCSCQKQQTEEERKAEVERQVQERLAAERQAQSEQQLAQRQAELEAREKALAEKQRAAKSAPVVEASETPLRASATDTSRNAATASYSTFYRELDPYGVWRETSSYGYVWQPREAERSRSWRPYTNGRWVYTDVGWTWISEEPFGWATYHYGRWTGRNFITGLENCIGISDAFATASAVGRPNGSITANAASCVAQNSRSARNYLTNYAIAPRCARYNCQPGSGINSITCSKGDAPIAPNASRNCDTGKESHANFAST